MNDQICTTSSSLSNPNMCKNISWPGCPAIKQYFSLPPPIIRYQAANPPTTKMYQKLTQSCKYFFEKNPILTVARIYDGGKKLCSSKNRECVDKNHKCCIKINFLKLRSNIWLIKHLSLSNSDIPNFVAIISQKIYLCDGATVLGICHKKITIKDFELLASKFRSFVLCETVMSHEDGRIVMLEEILKSIPKWKAFWYKFTDESPAATTSTLKNILKLKNLNDSRLFLLHNIPETFVLKDLNALIKNYKESKFRLAFRTDISDGYKIQLEQFVDEIIASEITINITYEGQNQEKLEKIKSFDKTSILWHTHM